LHFRNNLIEVSARAEGYWRPSQSFSSGGGLPAIYGFAGLGVFYSNPQAREIGSTSEVVAVWQNLRPERTEGVAYSPIGIAVPFGVGAKWVVNGGWQVGGGTCCLKREGEGGRGRERAIGYCCCLPARRQILEASRQ
jgi:hypothetical protein